MQAVDGAESRMIDFVLARVEVEAHAVKSRVIHGVIAVPV